MSLTYDQGRDAMLGIFKAAWDATGFPAVYDDTPASVPTTQTVWARAILRHAAGPQSSLAGSDGSVRYTNIGTLWVQVFAPVGDGSTAAYDAAQIVASAFRKARNPEVWFRNVRINEVGTKGSFEQINVLTDFEYDTVETSP